MPVEYLREVVRTDQKVNPLFRFLGVVVEEITPERCVLKLPFQEGLIQGAGVVAGGMAALLLDEAMAHVVIANLAPGQGTATADLHIRYFRAVKKDDLTATAGIVRRGSRLIVAEAELSGTDGQVVSKADASFMVIRA